MTRMLRTTAALAGLAAAVALLVKVGASGFPIPVDYYQYWSAGRLALAGENPYDTVRLHELQMSEGMTAPVPVISWHPPWTLAVSMPFGAMSITTGCLVWVLFQTVAVFTAATLLWRAFGGRPDRSWVAWAVTAAFAPTVYFLGAGQITGLCLLGVAGFVAAMQAGRPGLAGVAVALTAIKPHLLALFGLALLLGAIRDRACRKAVVTGGLTLIAATVVVAVVCPSAVGHYIAIVTGQNPASPYTLGQVRHPTAGWYLRAAIAPESFAVQLVPLALGAAIVSGAWWRQRGVWDWPRAVPWLVAGSVVASPYGTWVYDLVLLVVPVVAAAVWVVRPGVEAVPRAVAAVWLLGVSVGVFACIAAVTEKAFGIWIGWVSPTVFLGLATVWWLTRPALPPPVGETS